jgi:hypothetical protein
MLLTVYTATDFPVDLCRSPDPSAPPGTAGALGGAFVTTVDITEPRAFGRHCQHHVPPSANRPPGAWPRFVTAIAVDDQDLLPDPHGYPPACWIPSGAPSAAVVGVWEVTEHPDGSITITPAPGSPP